MATIWGRLMKAASAAVAAFNERDLIAMDAAQWDTESARYNRYRLYGSYYHNSVYKALLENAAIAQKQRLHLYKFIRGINNPVARLVDLYVAKVYGGSLDMQTATTGAVPLVQADDALREAIIQLWRWSNWGGADGKSLYVRYGAMLGDVFIKVVDDRQRQKVRMEVLHPDKIRSVKLDESGNVKWAHIEYERTDEVTDWKSNQSPKTYTYTEVISKDKFETYRDGAPYAYYANASGEPVAEWENEYGFVPLVKAKHKSMGLLWGANAFHTSLDKIDEVNDAASVLNDQIRKVVTPMWYFAGVKKAAELDGSTSDRDKLPAIYGPEASQPYPMIAQINIADASQNVLNMLAELERDMPELSLHRMRDMGNLTAPGVRAGYSDAIDRIDEARGNYDDGLIRAQQMGVTIGGIGGYPGFEAFDIGSYERGDLAHYIQERPVIQDALSKMERIQVLQSVSGADELVLRELDVDEDTIAEILTRGEQQKALAARAVMEAAFGTVSDDDETENASTGIDAAQPAQGVSGAESGGDGRADRLPD